jgi:hypothetical protein
MAVNQDSINFIALLNGLSEELGLPPPTYHPDRPLMAGQLAAICRFGNATVSGSGADLYSARNAAACVMWSTLGNGVRADTRYNKIHLQVYFVLSILHSPLPFHQCVNSNLLITSVTDLVLFCFRSGVVYPFVRVRLPLTVASIMPGIKGPSALYKSRSIRGISTYPSPC